MKRTVAGGRSSRVVEQVHQEIANLVRSEVKDPRLGLVTITGVDITPDYAFATVHFTVLPSDDETVKRTTQGLQSAAGYLKIQLGKRIRIHTTPTLRFKYDGSTERGLEMSTLIDEAMKVTNSASLASTSVAEAGTEIPEPENPSVGLK
jgi:ribosome-binding factor A